MAESVSGLSISRLNHQHFSPPSLFGEFASPTCVKSVMIEVVKMMATKHGSLLSIVNA